MQLSDRIDVVVAGSLGGFEMRQLKFRQPLLNRDGSFNKFHYWGIFPDSFVGREMSGCEKGDDQQFTGLLDKNSVEIYEGDILLGRYIHANMVVYYDSGQCGYELGCDWDAEEESYGATEHLLDDRNWEQEETEWEVIGNICENEELLK